MNRDLIEAALGALYDNAVRLTLQPGRPLVVFSDLHMGDGGPRDEFRPNGELMQTVLRDYYLAREYGLVLNGDIEELQRTSLPSVRASWQGMYDVFAAFQSRSALYKIVGNHDARLRNDGSAAEGLLDALRLEVGAGTIFLFHGHQATIFFEHFDWMADFLVRYVAKTLRIANAPVRYESPKRFVTERRVYEFSARRGILSVIGHTHRPLFESLSKIDSLKFRIEKLCREYPLASRLARSAIEKAIDACKAELKHLREKDARNGGRDSLYNETICVPCLFNSGCAIGKRGVTAIELTAERISLVHWYDSRRQVQSKATAGAIAGAAGAAPATQLGRTDFHRVVLKHDHLPYLFSRVRLLA